MLVSADIRKTSSNAWYSQSLHYPLLRNPQCMHYLVPSRDLRCGYRHVVVSVELCEQRRVKMKKKKKKKKNLTKRKGECFSNNWAAGCMY